MSATPTQLPRLPACQVCSQRKIKCDSTRPRCAPCSKAGIDCIISALDGDKPLTRESIHQLEQKARALSEAVAATEDSDGHVAVLERTEVDDVAAESPKNVSQIAEGSGLSFMKLLFTDSEWRESNTHLLRNLAKTSHASEANVRPNVLPSPEVARIVFDKYLNGSHIQNPFLLRQKIEDLYLRIFEAVPVITVHPNHDLFRAFMILAIGSVTLYRGSSHSAHPFGYYIAAMQFFDDKFLGEGLKAIQDLLLIGRFGIYYHIGTSIWDIAHLCIRMCIEQGLHQKSRGRHDLLEEQLRRRVFWECYMIDRYSSNTLHRPFAIAERDISVNFPADANDETIKAAQLIFPDLDTFRAAHRPTALSEMSVFFLCIRLRQIVSRIHSEFSRFVDPASHSGFQTFLLTGHICKALDELLHDLEEWRSLAPVFPVPRSLYDSQEWFDLLYFRERLILVRKAVDLVPKRNGVPPEHLLDLCLESATSTINLFSRLYREGRITYTRSYFQMMFTAGLSAMFCVSASSDLRCTAVQQALKLCEGTLRDMGTKLPDAIHYVTIYEALHRNVAKKWDSAPVGTSTEFPTSSIGGLLPRETPSVSISGSSINHANNLNTFQAERGGNNDPSRNSPFHNVDFANDPTLLADPWSNLTQSANETYNIVQQDEMFLGDDPLQWTFLNDDTFWNMEAGLGEYAYGDLNANPDIARAFDFTF